MCPKEYGRWKDIGDDKCETNIQMMSNANVMSAHGVQDEDESYDKLLNRLSAESEMRIEGWSRTCYFESTVTLQVHKTTNTRK